MQRRCLRQRPVRMVIVGVFEEMRNSAMGRVWEVPTNVWETPTQPDQ
ncbi:MAG: hypothetical protein WBD36_15200 [Bacteroidota bacterium]